MRSLYYFFADLNSERQSARGFAHQNTLGHCFIRAEERIRKNKRHYQFY